MGVKISELTEANSVANSDVLPIVQGGETKKVSTETLLNNIQNQIDTINTDLAVLENGEDISSNISLNENGSATLVKIGKIVFLNFFGENKARSSGQLLATINNYLPNSNTRAVFVASNGSAVGNILINSTTGQITIEGINTNVTGRVFFQTFYLIS